MPPHNKKQRLVRRASSSPPPEVDSEEDEWEKERQQRVQVGSSKGHRAFEQEEDEEEDVEEDEEIGSEDEDESEDDGIAQFAEDEGEVIESDDEEASLGKQLSSIPFGSLLKAKKKLAKRAQRDESEDDSDDQPETSDATRKGRGGREKGRRVNGRNVERSSKHAPMEMSSKRAVARTRAVVETAANKARDPRFDSLSGNFKADLFKTGYGFLAQAQTTELEQLRKTAIAARKNPMLPQEEKDKIEAALTRMQSREVSRKTKERDSDALKQWKKDELSKRGEGKKEFYLKKSDQKAVLLKAKFDVLATDKKTLRKAIEKKRKKTHQQDKKLMPNTR